MPIKRKRITTKTTTTYEYDDSIDSGINNSSSSSSTAQIGEKENFNDPKFITDTPYQQDDYADGDIGGASELTDATEKIGRTYADIINKFLGHPGTPPTILAIIAIIITYFAKPPKEFNDLWLTAITIITLNIIYYFKNIKNVIKKVVNKLYFSKSFPWIKYK